MRLAIIINDLVAPLLCPLCNRKTNPNIGFELVLIESQRVVCRDCGRLAAPALVVLLELSSTAEELMLHSIALGERWQASRKGHSITGLNWNKFNTGDEK